MRLVKRGPEPRGLELEQGWWAVVGAVREACSLPWLVPRSMKGNALDGGVVPEDLTNGRMPSELPP